MERKEIRRMIARGIRAARDPQMTQADLERAIGVGVGTVGRWEKAGALGLDDAVLLAQTLKVSLDELVFGSRPFYERAVAEAAAHFQGQLRESEDRFREELRRAVDERVPPKADQGR